MNCQDPSGRSAAPRPRQGREPDGILNPLEDTMIDPAEVKKFKIFSVFGDEEVARLAQHLRESDHAEGATIFEPASPASELFFIVSGKVNLTRWSGSGLKIFTSIEKGELFGEVGFIDGMPRTAGASAQSKTKLYGLPADAFLRYQQENPLHAARLVAELMKDLARKFRAVNEGLDVKSAEYTLHEIILGNRQVKISTMGGADYVCHVKHADLTQQAPLLKIDVKGQTVLLPYHQVKSITLPDKFGNY